MIWKQVEIWEYGSQIISLYCVKLDKTWMFDKKEGGGKWSWKI